MSSPNYTPATPKCEHWGHEPGEWKYSCCACSGIPNGCEHCQTDYWDAKAEAEGETCRRCGGPNVTWSAQSPLWNFVMRGNDINGDDRFGIVCVACFVTCAVEAGLPALGWRLTLAPEPDGLVYETPSGRIWDEERFQWVEPKPVIAIATSMDGRGWTDGNAQRPRHV